MSVRTQYKDAKITSQESAGRWLALLPALMVADIILYDAALCASGRRPEANT